LGDFNDRIVGSVLASLEYANNDVGIFSEACGRNEARSASANHDEVKFLL
jgi:hypothetical protein